MKKREKEQGKTWAPGSDKELIDRARKFFMSEIEHYDFGIKGFQNERQKLRKTPLWERAVVRTGSKGEVVTVPLKYEKDLAFSHEGKEKKFYLEDLSNLLIYEKPGGGLTAEVVTYLPKGDLIRDVDKDFNGTVLVEDWGGNAVDRFFMEGKKRYKFVENGAASRISMSEGCYVIVWYICDVVNGVYSNCRYAYTEYAPACNEGLEPCNDGCGGEYIDYEVEEVKATTYEWIVQYLPEEAGGGWLLQANRLLGKFNSRRPERNRFLGGYISNIILAWNKWGSNGNVAYFNTSSTVTVNSNTRCTLASSGSIKFLNHNNDIAHYSGTRSVMLSECYWPV